MNIVVLLSCITLARAYTAIPASVYNEVETRNLRQPQASILRLENQVDDQGFHYAYEGSDGSKAEQRALVIPGSDLDSGTQHVTGSYSYVGTDGRPYSVKYSADENGFHAQGEHLPTPPPLPEALVRALQEIAQRPQGNGDDSGQYYVKSGYRY